MALTARWPLPEGYQLNVKTNSLRQDKAMHINQLIRQIEVRPELYLSERSICHLRCYLDGWISGKEDCLGEADDNLDQMSYMYDFQQWIAARFDVESSQSWDNIIAFYSGNRVSGLDEAFRLFREFAALRGLEGQPPPDIQL